MQLYADLIVHTGKMLYYLNIVIMSKTCKKWHEALDQTRRKAMRYRLLISNPRMISSFQNYMRDELLYMQNYSFFRTLEKHFSVPAVQGVADNYFVLRALIECTKNKHISISSDHGGPLVFTTKNVQNGLIGIFYCSDFRGACTMETLVSTFGRKHRIFYTSKLFVLPQETLNAIETVCIGNIILFFRKIARKNCRCVICQRIFNVNIPCTTLNPGLGNRCFSKFSKEKRKVFMDYCASTKRSFISPIQQICTISSV